MQGCVPRRLLLQGVRDGYELNSQRGGLLSTEEKKNNPGIPSLCPIFGVLMLAGRN